MGIFEQLSSIVGGTSRHDVIERVVDKMLPARKQQLYPAGLSHICKDRGIHLSIVNAGSVVYRGRFDWVNDQSPRIILRRDANYRRQNFTLAHELGHWMTQCLLPDLRHESYRLSADRSPGSEEEKIADEIAIELLMPRSAFNLGVRQACSLRSLDRLCDVFQVQRAIAMQRLAMLLKAELIYVTLVPMLPTKLNSYAVIDDVWLVEPFGRLDRMRDQVETTSPMPFSVLQGKFDLELVVQGETRSYAGECEYLQNNYPSVKFFGKVQQQGVCKVLEQQLTKI